MPPKGVPMSPEQLAKLALAKAHEAIKAKAELTKTMNTKEKILKRQLVKDFVSQLKNPEPEHSSVEPEPVAEPKPEKEQEVLPKKKGRPRKYHLDEPAEQPKTEIKTEIKPEPVVAEPVKKTEPEPLLKEPKKKVKKVIYQSESDSEEEEVVIVKRKPKQRKQKIIYRDHSDSDSEPEMVYRQKSKSRQREYKEPEPVVEQPRRMNYANHLINLCKAGYQFS